MSIEKQSKENLESKTKDEIEIENKDLLNVFFDNSGSQFESQFFLSRKRMLNAENGQNELSDLLKSKLKALEMMLLILSNNKNILKESDLSCCEVLNNLLSVSKKDKAYGEHIYSKIKTIMIYFIKNKISLEEKNVEENKILIKFLLTLLNIKFDNGYFKQILEIISNEKDLFEIFIKELFNKLFKGRNITIKIKEMKFILKSILINDKIIKEINYFDIMELILNYAKERQNGGCRTSFQLNQVVFLLQYMIEIINISEIKKNLPNEEASKVRLLKIIEIYCDSLNDLINKDDYDFDKNKISKKNLKIKNENIKRKKNFFSEMLNFLNKLKKNFTVIGDKEFNDKLEEINNLYKNIINTKYVVVVNNNNIKNDNNNNKKSNDKKNYIKNEKMEEEEKDEIIDDSNNNNAIEEEEKEVEEINEDKNKINIENKDEKEENENEKEGLKLEEEPEIKKEETKDKNGKQKKYKDNKKENNKKEKRKQKNNTDEKKNKNKKKKK